MAPKRLSIIIPVYNEETRIVQTVREALSADSLDLTKEVIVVDDGSTDGTVERLKEMPEFRQITLIEKKENKGKGAALKSGFKAATGDILLVQDADLEYSVKDYPALLQPFVDGKAEVVYGSRNKKRDNYHNRYSYLSFYVGGLVLTWLINVLFGLNISDQPTGYKLVSAQKKHLLLNPLENGFSYEVAMTAVLAKDGVSFYEVPIHYKPRSMSDGKKIGAGDFIASVLTAVYYRLTSS